MAHGVVSIVTLAHLFTQAVQQVNRVVGPNAHGHGRDQGIGNVQRNVEEPHHAEDGQHRQRQRCQDEQPRHDRAKRDGRDEEHRQGNLRNVEQLAMHHGVGQRDGLGHVAAKAHGDLGTEQRFGFGLQGVDQHLDLGIAAGLEQQGDLGGAVVVVHHAVEVAGAARQGIQQQVLRHQLARGRQHMGAGLVGLHGLVHAFEVVHHRQGFADVGLGLCKGLQLLNAAQHLGRLDAVRPHAFHHDVEAVGTAKLPVEEIVVTLNGQ